MTTADKRQKTKKISNRKKRQITKHTMQTLEAMSKWDDDCLIWQGYTIEGKHPQVCHDGKMWMVRKLVMHLSGKTLPERAYYKPVCDDPHCIRLEHIKIVDSVRHMRSMAKVMNHNAPARIVKLQKAASHRRKLTDEQVLQIRTSLDSTANLALQYGVCTATIKKIKNNQARRVINASTNPFAGLIR